MSNKNTDSSVKKNSWWYYIERYVHISIKKNDILFYNTLTGKYLEYRGQKDIVRFVRRMITGKNLQVTKVTRDYLDNHPVVYGFIKKTKKRYMADMLDTAFSRGKPIQMMNILNIHKDIKKMQSNPERSIGEDIIKNIDQINLYIQSRINPHLGEKYPLLFKSAYKQFLFNHHRTDVDVELAVELIRKLFDDIRGSQMTFINVLGGDIFQYSQLNELFQILVSTGAITRFFVNLADILQHIQHIRWLLTKVPVSQLVVFIPLPITVEEVKPHIDAVQEIGIPVEYLLVVQDDIQMASAIVLQSSPVIPNISIQPFYNKRNLTFFKKHVFLTKSDILSSKPEIKDISMRTVVNPGNFGKLTVLTNGKVYANINAPSLGKLDKDSIYEMVYREMKGGRSWMRVRSSVKPCKECLYNLLCPPLTNYEYAIGRNNLCNCI